MLWVIIIAFMLLSWAVSSKLKAKFKKYSRTPLHSGLTGKEIAEKMLSDHQIYDVKVTCVEGHLTDHYNPANKTVNLSKAVYFGNSAASAAVAAHECGHAVQHARAYSMLEFRSAMVPVQNVSARILNFVVMATLFGGFFLFQSFPYNLVLLIIIGAHAVITLFSLITLPVEFDASKRALQWMTNRGVVNSSEQALSKDALKWAALTYVVAALGSLASLLYYISLFLGNND